MSGWNLPPDCNVSDIPGNRPDDDDDYTETVLGYCFRPLTNGEEAAYMGAMPGTLIAYTAAGGVLLLSPDNSISEVTPNGENIWAVVQRLEIE